MPANDPDRSALLLPHRLVLGSTGKSHGGALFTTERDGHKEHLFPTFLLVEKLLPARRAVVAPVVRRRLKSPITRQRVFAAKHSLNTPLTPSRRLFHTSSVWLNHYASRGYDTKYRLTDRMLVTHYDYDELYKYLTSNELSNEQTPSRDWTSYRFLVIQVQHAKISNALEICFPLLIASH